MADGTIRMEKLLIMKISKYKGVVKMMKRIGVLILSIVILIGCVGVSAVDERVLIGEIDVVTDGTSTTVTAQVLSKPAGKSAVLVAAYMHPETGRILSVNIDAREDISLLEGNELTVTLEDKTEDGGVLSYNIWDSLAGNMSILNNSPTAPEGLLSAEGVSDATISWEGAIDDYDSTDSLTYNIYDDGILLAENCAALEYTAENLADDTNYNFEVRAVDSEGKESEIGEVSTTTLTKNTTFTTDEYTQSQDANVEFTGSLTDSTRLFYVERDNAGGLDCFKTTLRPKDGSGTYVMYKFADDYFAELEGVKAVYCELTYFDEGSERVVIDIFLGQGSGSVTKNVAITKTNTGTWKTARIYYTLPAGTSFIKNTNEGNGYFNFRIKSDLKDVGLKVRKFSAYPIFDTDTKTDEYYTLKKNAGSYFTADGGTLVCDLASNMAGFIPEELGDRTGIKLSSVNNEATFKVTDSELYSGNVKVLVTYYAPDKEATISLNGEEKAVTASGKWQKMCFDIENIGSAINTITSNKDIAINAIRVISAD